MIPTGPNSMETVHRLAVIYQKYFTFYRTKLNVKYKFYSAYRNGAVPIELLNWHHILIHI